jgi:hypothetical protein
VKNGRSENVSGEFAGPDARGSTAEPSQSGVQSINRTKVVLSLSLPLATCGVFDC